MSALTVGTCGKLNNVRIQAIGPERTSVLDFVGVEGTPLVLLHLLLQALLAVLQALLAVLQALRLDMQSQALLLENLFLTVASAPVLEELSSTSATTDSCFVPSLPCWP